MRDSSPRRHRARGNFIGIGHLTDHQIEAIRSPPEQEVAERAAGHRRSDSLKLMLKRR